MASRLLSTTTVWRLVFREVEPRADQAIANAAQVGGKYNRAIVKGVLMPAPVVVSLLLKNSGGVPGDALRCALDELGLSERTEGRASWTVRVEPARFEELFRVRPVHLPGKPPGQGDMGAPPGYAVEGELLVPESLREFIESAGVEPPMTRFNR